MACCTVAAYFIYRLIQVHEAISGLRPTYATSLSHAEKEETQPAGDSSIGAGLRSCRLSLTGLTCTDCSTSVRNALLAHPGIISAHVSFVLCQAYVTFDHSHVDVKTIISTVEDRGYGAELEIENPTWRSRFRKVQNQRRQEANSWKDAFVTSALLTIFVFVLPYMPMPYDHSALAIFIPVLQATCSATILFVCAYRIHLEAFRSILRMKPNMALLSSLGMLLGFIQALGARGCADFYKELTRPYSFDALAALCVVVLGGRYLKAMTTQSSFALTAQLAESIPRIASVTFARDEKQDPFDDSAPAPVDMLRDGDWVIVSPQTVIPGDGHVVRGSSSVLESLRTGELLPKQKRVGDQVFAGTSNQGSRLVVQLAHDANDTWLEKTLRHVAQAEGAKIQRKSLIDAVMDRFVSIVICLTLATCLAWRAGAHASWSLCLERGAAMLLCACPCALGLAKPTCMTLTIAVASQNDVLFAGGAQQLEDAANVKALLFDKTGTLTTGHLHVQRTKVESFWKTSPAHAAILWAAVGKIEQHSQHPVAVLLAEESKRQLAKNHASHDIVEVFHVHVYDGLGIRATVRTATGDIDMAIGSLKLMDNITPDGSLRLGFNTSLDNTDNAYGAVYVSVDGQAAMSITWSDTIRSDAVSTVKALQAQGIEVGLVTGDTEASARRVASAVGISPEWTFANALPVDKVRIMEQIDDRFGPVAMVGDNFNDIPALASAAFSISVGNTSGVSSAVDADAHLPQAGRASFDLLRVPYLLALAKVAHSTIRANVTWAVIYNILAMVLSSGCLQFLHPGLVMTPSMASLGMCISSTLVVMNSMGVQRQSPKVEW